MRLLAEGWKPYLSKYADKCTEGDIRCEGRPEIESCSGFEAAAGKFIWTRDGIILNISTVGMEFVEGEILSSVQDNDTLGGALRAPRKIRNSPNKIM